jgi:hypothetical protein
MKTPISKKELAHEIHACLAAGWSASVAEHEEES